MTGSHQYKYLFYATYGGAFWLTVLADLLLKIGDNTLIMVLQYYSIHSLISLLLTALVKCGMLNFKSIKCHVWNAQAKLCYEFDIEKQTFPLSLQFNIQFHILIEMRIVFVNGFASLSVKTMMTYFSGLRDVDYV